MKIVKIVLDLSALGSSIIFGGLLISHSYYLGVIPILAGIYVLTINREDFKIVRRA